jgi:hypothetical protein
MHICEENKMNLEQIGQTWTGINWLKIGSRCGFCGHNNESSRNVLNGLATIRFSITSLLCEFFLSTSLYNILNNNTSSTAGYNSRSRNSSVGIAAGYRLEGPGSISNMAKKNFCSP